MKDILRMAVLIKMQIIEGVIFDKAILDFRF